MSSRAMLFFLHSPFILLAAMTSTDCYLCYKCSKNLPWWFKIDEDVLSFIYFDMSNMSDHPLELLRKGSALGLSLCIFLSPAFDALRYLPI